jgi:O-6-methylguanine DNA methyltransferase
MFADRVYKTLKGKVPKGKVTTYKALAQAIGKPKAARAVGNALNKNPHAPVVPCHRVVKSDGSLGGYALGDSKKLALLKKEGVVIEKGRIPKRFILSRL